MIGESPAFCPEPTNVVFREATYSRLIGSRFVCRRKALYASYVDWARQLSVHFWSPDKSVFSSYVGHCYCRTGSNCLPSSNTHVLYTQQQIRVSANSCARCFRLPVTTARQTREVVTRRLSAGPALTVRSLLADICDNRSRLRSVLLCSIRWMHSRHAVGWTSRTLKEDLRDLMPSAGSSRRIHVLNAAIGADNGPVNLG